MTELELIAYPVSVLPQVGERIRVILDCDDNTLAFERSYEFLGVAFRGETIALPMGLGRTDVRQVGPSMTDRPQGTG